MRPLPSILRAGAIGAAFAAYVVFAARLPLEFHAEAHSAATCAAGCPDSAPEPAESPGSHSPEHCPICVAILATAHALALDPPVQLMTCSGAVPAGRPPLLRMHGVVRPTQIKPRGPPAA